MVVAIPVMIALVDAMTSLMIDINFYRINSISNLLKSPLSRKHEAGF